MLLTLYVAWCCTLHCVVLVAPSPFPSAENCSLVPGAAVKPFIRETQQRPLTLGVVPSMFLYLYHTTPVSSVFYLCCLTVNAWYLLFTQPMKVLAGGYWQSQGWSHKTHLGSSDVTWFANCLVKKHLIRNGTARKNNYPNGNLTADCCIYKYPEMLPVHLQWHRSPNSGQLLNRWTNSGFN